MYVSRVKVENIRGFSGPRNVDLTLTRPDGSHAGWTVIAGRNGSGKTSLLRAIALTVSGPSVVRSLLPDVRDWISTAESRGSTELELIRGNYDAVTVRQTGPQESVSLRPALSWHRADLTGRPLQSDEQPKLIAPEGNLRTALEAGPWDDSPLGWFCAAYGPFRRLIGGGADAQQLMAAPGPVSRLVSLFYEAASLTEGVQWLIDQHLRALEHRPGAAELKDVALRILADGLLPDKYQIRDVNSDGLWVVRDGPEFPLREMSDGYRTVAALVIDLLKQVNDTFWAEGLTLEMRDGIPTVPYSGVVLIDEVDAHLHVSWQKRIGGWLKAHFPHIQFIVTTHSPYVCQAADPGGLIRLPGPDEDQPPRVVDQDLYDRIVYGSGDDAVLSELFGLDTPYSEQAEHLRQELVALETKVLRGEADEDEITDYRVLRRRLASSPVARADEVAARLRPSDDSDRAGEPDV